MRYFCTLFDSKYLPQGLALYESLKRHSSEPFTLYVLPMDQECEETLISMVLPNIVLVHGFHDWPNMKKARENRTHQEYCWTAASQLAEMLLPGVDAINYIDADCFFFSDPKVIFDEIGERSIGIIPHRFIPSKKHLEVNGQFNVSLVHFKNDPVGRECLSTWAWQCREKCSLKDGCGDQKYLDAWPDKYGPELCVIQNIGVGLAPWNLANYGYLDQETMDGWSGRTMISDKISDGPWHFTEVTMYHFHEFRWQRDKSYLLSHYSLRDKDIELIYKPYIQAVEAAKGLIASSEAVHL